MALEQQTKKLSEIKQTSCDKSCHTLIFYFLRKKFILQIHYSYFLFSIQYLLYFLHELNFKSNNI